MTDAAILATFSDFRLVKGRKIGQLVFEIPIERVKVALDTLGMPDTAHEVWCGIARVDVKLKSGPPLDTGPAEGGAAIGSAAAPPKRNSQRAALLLKNPDFRRFISALTDTPPTVIDERMADARMKEHLWIKSKADLDDPEAAIRFADFVDQYRAWRQAEGHGVL